MYSIRPQRQIFIYDYEQYYRRQSEFRLFQHVREDKGLSYAIYSYGSAFKQCGLFQIDAAMNPEQTIQVLEAIKEVIGSLFEKAPITEHELHLAKEQIRTELIIDTESTHNHMESNAKR